MLGHEDHRYREPEKARHCLAPVCRLERASAEAEGGAAGTGGLQSARACLGWRGIAPAKGQAGARGFVDGHIREGNAASGRLTPRVGVFSSSASGLTRWRAIGVRRWVEDQPYLLAYLEVFEFKIAALPPR